MKERIHKNWMVALVLIVLIICGTVIWLNYNAWTIRFEMDDNTLKAIESIEWDSFSDQEDDFKFTVRENVTLMEVSSFGKQGDCESYTFEEGDVNLSTSYIHDGEIFTWGKKEYFMFNNQTGLYLDGELVKECVEEQEKET